MLESPVRVETAIAQEPVRSDIESVCELIPPVWDLPNFVAVNPFLGYSGVRLDEAARRMADGLGASALPPLDYYRWRWKSGAFSAANLGAAARRAGVDEGFLVSVLSGREPIPMRSRLLVTTFAEMHDRMHGTDWNGTIVRSAARWCAVFASRGGSHWRVSDGMGLYRSWREAARVDRSLDLAGLRGFRSGVSSLPDRPEAVIEEMLSSLDVPARQRRDYLYRLLGGLYGWACHFRRDAWERDPRDVGQVRDVLAIRIAMDAAVARLAPGARPFDVVPLPAGAEDESLRLVLQDALEDGFASRLLHRFQPPSSTNALRPAVQAVFCIDVRSEPLRRHLESQSDLVETRGFAGFFGVAVDWQDAGSGSARCPVLLKPSFCLRGASGADAMHGIAAHVQGAPGSAFAFVEMLGLFYGIRMAGDSAALHGGAGSHEESAPIDLGCRADGIGIGEGDRVALADGILRNMGFSDRFARIVLLCGHAGRCSNNPHAAGLDCGACGGHGGALNARVAAALLNDPEVRSRLRDLGWGIPSDTCFLPALHDTSTDDVRFMDIHSLPPGHRRECEDLRAQLDAASAAVRRERSAALGVPSDDPVRLRSDLVRRSRDWSEARPEWALARNAAFIAARRCRTRGLNLKGRAFLHEYDESVDHDGSVLRLVLSAPMVVASWINLQYFASTVDNDVLGAGDKALHNRVGRVGVVLGNGGDLRTGLPLQSVQSPDGRWFHEPLRLQVVVEASKSSIDAALAALPAVEQLVSNGWVRLFQLPRDQSGMVRRLPEGGWEHR